MLINNLVSGNVSLEHEKKYCLSEQSRMMKSNHASTIVFFRNMETFLFPIFPGIFSSEFKTVG